MNILVLDDEKLAMNHLVYILEKISLENKIIGFCSPTEAIIAVESGQFQPQIAFLDIEMYGVNGLEVAKRLKESIPTIGIIFTTAYSDYAIDAFRIHARGYLLKPLTIERVREEIDEIGRAHV